MGTQNWVDIALRHQAITWTNVDWSSVRSNDNHQRAISQEIPQPSIKQNILKIPYLQFHSNLPGANELNWSCVVFSIHWGLHKVAIILGFNIHFHTFSLIQISLWIFYPRAPIDNNSSLAHVSKRHVTGDKSLSEPTMTWITATYMCHH